MQELPNNCTQCLSCIVWTLPESTMEKWNFFLVLIFILLSSLRGTAAHCPSTLSDNTLNMKHCLIKKTLQNQAPRNRGVITHQNLASLWSTRIVYTLWIVITSDNLPPSPFLNNMVLQVFFLLPFSQSFSFFLRVLFLRLAIGDFCFACN